MALCRLLDPDGRGSGGEEKEEEEEREELGGLVDFSLTLIHLIFFYAFLLYKSPSPHRLTNGLTL